MDGKQNRKSECMFQMKMMISGALIVVLMLQMNIGNALPLSSNEYNRPIIGKSWQSLLVNSSYFRELNLGILSQSVPSTWQKPNGTTYIAASYVKYIEATGAQVVPVLYGIK